MAIQTGTTTSSPTPRPGADIEYQKFLDCVHCGLCTAACPTYQVTGDENDGPRGRIYLMRSVTDGRLELVPEVRRHLELCLDCRACESACPSGVQYGRLIEPFRAAMEQATPEGQRPKTADWFHRLVLFGILPYPRRMRWALAPARTLQWLRLDRLLKGVGFFHLLPARLRRLHAMLPPRMRREPRLPELLPAQGTRRARVALFTGCVSEAMFRHTNWATARVLQANGCEVVVPRHQVCCGAIHYHSGAEEAALRFAETNARAFDPRDYDAVVTNVAGCGAMLKDYGHLFGDGADASPPAGESALPGSPQAADSADAESRSGADSSRGDFARQFAASVRDVSEFLIELGPVSPEGELPVRATYHDACHLAHAQQIRAAPRKLLAMIPGLQLVPLAESELCCGAAGTYNLTEPEMSERLAHRKRDHILATNTRAVFTANAGCLLQIGRSLREARSTMWVAHPIEALDRSYRREPAPGRSES